MLGGPSMKQLTLAEVESAGEQCPTCGEVFDTRQGLGQHHAMLHGETIQEYEYRKNADSDCPSCDRSFHTQRGVKIHHKRIHGTSIVEKLQHHTPCPTCGKADFKTTQGMKTHHIRVHGESIAGVEAECDFCGEKFRRCSAHLEGQTHNFCSERCAGDFRSEYYTGERNPFWVDYPIFRCEQCGDEYEVKPSEASTSRFCSYDCHGDWMSENLHGPAHPAWAGGKSVLDAVRKTIGSESWVSQRQRIRKRDDNQCQQCGIEGDELSQGLDVHHIIPILAGGCNADELLMSLCPQCHNHIEANTKRFTGPVLVE